MTDPIDQSIGMRVKLARKMAGFSQKQIANLLGVSFKAFQKYELGLNKLGASSLFKLATLLDRDPEWFFGGMPSPQNGEIKNSVNGAEEVSNAMMRQELIELVRCYSLITPKKARWKLMDLVVALAAEDKNGRIIN